jgi:hypothetical protein
MSGEPRAMAYRPAALTGFRETELRRLTPERRHQNEAIFSQVAVFAGTRLLQRRGQDGN